MDSDEVDSRLRLIRENLAFLRSKQALSFDELVEDHDVLSSVKYDLHVAIQAAIDVGLHLLAGQPVQAAEHYRDVFRLMGEVGMLPREFATRITPMAGFRNVLVHVYMGVDPRKVHDIVHNQLDDLEHYVEHVSRYVAEHPDD